MVVERIDIVLCDPFIHQATYGRFELHLVINFLALNYCMEFFLVHMLYFVLCT